MKPAFTEITPPIDKELLAFQNYVATKAPSSSKPIKATAYLWSRFLQRKLSDFGAVQTVAAKPSKVAKFNDGFGVSGISLSSAVSGIRYFLNGGAEQ
jgi:hypothetical protein